MSYIKKYEVGISRPDNTYKNFVHELPLLSFGDARNTFALSLIFLSNLTDNPFHIANGYKLSIQKRIIFDGGYPQSYEDGDGKLVKLNRFNNKYAFDDGSQRFIRLINGQYVLENPDFSTEVFDISGNILFVKDKYANTILSYTYSSGKLISVIYKNCKTVTIDYNSNDVMQYIRYVHSDSTFQTAFNYLENGVKVSHYSGVDYYFDYGIEQDNSSYGNYVSTTKTLEVYSTNAGEENNYYYKNKAIAVEGSGELDGIFVKDASVTITKCFDGKTIDETSYIVDSCDADGNVQILDVVDFNRVTTIVHFEKGKPSYSYEYLNDMFIEDTAQNNYLYYPGKVTFYNNEQISGYQDHDDGFRMSCSTVQSGFGPNKYTLQHAFSGRLTVSGWLQPVGNDSECCITITGNDETKVIKTHKVTGLWEGIWTYFSVSFDMDGDGIVRACTDKENYKVKACDFRLSDQNYSAEELDEYKDNLISSSGILIHTDSSGIDHPIPMTEVVEFINGSSLIGRDAYPITINDLMRIKINQTLGTNRGEIYYNDGRGILPMAGTFKVCYKQLCNESIPLDDLAIGKMYSYKNNKYLTKINIFNENGAVRLKSESFKNSLKLATEIYDAHFDLIESTAKGVTTTYVRNTTNGLVESQMIAAPGNESVSTSATYNANDYLESTTDEFGVITTYTTDPIWGVVTKSVVSDGVTVTDTFDADCATLLSRAFDNAATKKHEFTYLNGFLSTMKNDTLTYTMGYNKDILSSIQKNGLLIGEFDTSVSEYGGKTENEHYPNSANPNYTISRKYDQYGRIAEITGLLKNTYDIAPTCTNGAYSMREIKNGSAKLAKRQDFITGNTTKYGYQNDRLTHIGEFDSVGAKVKEETLSYDENGRLAVDKFTYDINGNFVQRDITYFSEDSDAAGAVHCYYHKINGSEIAETENTYDAYKRVTSKTYTVGDQEFTKDITYCKTRIAQICDSVGGALQYEYDSMGRISKEKDGSGAILKSYTYDAYGQLVRENNAVLDKTFIYEYDTIGNVTKVKTYAYTTSESLGGVLSEKSMGYSQAYPDRLTSCGSTSVNYNAMGYPTTYDGYTVSWTRGKLSRLTRGNRISGTHTYSYNYNALGQRISRGYTYSLPTMDTSAVVAGMLTGYSQTFKYDQSGRLVYEVKTSEYYGEMSSSDSIVYLYDENSIVGMVYTSEMGTTATYYFHRNLLGDVIGIYNTNGTKVGGYAYDAWGNCTITLNTNGIATRNPIRYRGYYYDDDTKLYYLNSRYYCPKWHRFISPDSIEYLDPESINGLNLYCYCHNNPIMYVDPDGHMPKWAQWVVGGLAIAGLVVATVLTCGVAGAGAAAVGAAMLAGGLVSAGINVVDQLSDGGEFDWTELAISTLSGTAYGLVVGLTGGAGGWAVAGKFAVAGGTSLLNSWNQNASFGETMKSLGTSLLTSGIAQGAGYLAGKFGPQLLTKFMPRNPNHLLTMGDIGSALWAIPAVKTGAIRFAGGVFGAIFNDF